MNNETDFANFLAAIDNKDTRYIRNAVGWLDKSQINDAFDRALDLGNIEIMDMLYKAGEVDIGKGNIENAVENHNWDIIQFLLDRSPRRRLGRNLNYGNIALLRAIEHARTDIVKSLAEYGVDLFANDNNALVLAAELDELDIVEYLVEAGADVNAQNSAPIGFAIQKGYDEVVEYLLSKGAIVNDNVFYYAVEKNNLPLVERFLKILKPSTEFISQVIESLNEYLEAKFSAWNSEQTDPSIDPFEYITDFRKMIALLQKYNRQYRLQRLQSEIFSSLEKRQFKWQKVCSTMGEKDISELVETASALGLPHSALSKRQLCASIADHMYKSDETCKDTNLLGEDLTSLPQWRIFKIDGVCFDILDLSQILASGETRNPFTRQELPVQDIKDRLATLQGMSIKSLESETLLTRVAESQIYSPAQHLKSLVVKLFQSFPYMLDTKIILDATDDQVDVMISKLFETDANLILRVSNRIVDAMKSAVGIDKKIQFVTVLLSEPTDEKKVLLYDAFVYFSKLRDNQSVDQDTFMYMIGGGFLQ